MFQPKYRQTSLRAILASLKAAAVLAGPPIGVDSAGPRPASRGHHRSHRGYLPTGERLNERREFWRKLREDNPHLQIVEAMTGWQRHQWLKAGAKPEQAKKFSKMKHWRQAHQSSLQPTDRKRARSAP